MSDRPKGRHYSHPSLEIQSADRAHPAYGNLEPDRLRHMEMIQAAIGRAAANSFLVKGWAITVSGAFLGFAVSRDEVALAGGAVLPIAFFWALDAFYLQAERLFRILYDCVCRKDPDLTPFFMGALGPEFRKTTAKAETSLRRVLRSQTLFYFYGCLVASAGVVAGLLACN